MVGREREVEGEREAEWGGGGSEVVRQLISFWPNSRNLSEHSP